MSERVLLLAGANAVQALVSERPEPVRHADLAADDQMRSALDQYDKGFGCRAGVGVHHAKRITTWLPKLDVGGELAGLIGLRG